MGVMCIRQHAMEKSTQDPIAAARTAESGVGAQAPTTETPGEACAAGNTDVEERFFVGDIVRIEGGVGKGYQGEEAQVSKITKKTMVVVLTTGKHTGKTRPWSHHCAPSCRAARFVRLRSMGERPHKRQHARLRRSQRRPQRAGHQDRQVRHQTATTTMN